MGFRQYRRNRLGVNNKLIVLIVLILIMIVSFFISICNTSSNKTEFPNVKKIVKYLCSEKVSDRAIGSEGNNIVTKYIESIYNSINLEVVFAESYLQEFTVNEHIINNVVGKLSGENNNIAIVITAHFDAWYNGALDNASGVSVLLNIADELSKEYTETQFRYDIIFCATNAEMNMFRGSEKFVSEIKNSYDELYNINIDCVGAKKAGPIALKNISKVNNSKKLYDQIKDSFKKNNIDFIEDFSTEKLKMAYEQNMGVSDYISFEEENIANIHIAQKGISDFILSEEDKPKNLDYDELESLSQVLSYYIKNLNLE